MSENGPDISTHSGGPGYRQNAIEVLHFEINRTESRLTKLRALHKVLLFEIGKKIGSSLSDG